MAKIHINNPKQVINGGAKKYYFKVKGLGGPKGDKGDKGDTGATGPQGPQGNAATVSVGSTTTLPVGQDATVENVGTLYNAVLNFGIPQGPRGPQGATGATGAKGDKGDQGNPGPQGEKGTNATVYVGTTSTLNPGSQATVYNSGTDSNAVLNFGIPKGEKGDTGPMPTIAQTTGQAADQVMSQKATTDALNTKQDTISSSNKLSADLVTDTSTTNKFVTASDITNWNGKQDALTAGTGIDITGGVISTPAIVPEVVAELPTTGTEGKLYLTPKAHTTSTATGNPIEATITEQAGQLESFQLDGDTYQQTYTGKNLLKLNDATITLGGVPITTTNGTVNLNGTATSSAQGYYVTIGMTASEPMVFSTNKSGTTSGLDVKLQYKRGGTIYYPSVGSSFSLQAGDIIQQMYLMITNGSTLDGSFSPMLEAGSSATSFEPYVGGQPSPSPDYPQPIQTVTGTQTISINGTDYPIELGSIELCKLSTYQDYIWKDGESWKVHKATAKTILDSSSFGGWSSTTAAGGYFRGSSSQIGFPSAVCFCNCLTPRTGAHGSYEYIYTQPTDIGAVYIQVLATRLSAATLAGFNEWIDSVKPILFYTLTTATDTVITDTDLIAQLEAIRTASLENGTNTITNTAAGTNLAGDMEIGYFGFNPTNRYDKFIWLDLNNNYEQIGGE